MFRHIYYQNAIKLRKIRKYKSRDLKRETETETERALYMIFFRRLCGFCQNDTHIGCLQLNAWRLLASVQEGALHSAFLLLGIATKTALLVSPLCLMSSLLQI